MRIPVLWVTGPAGVGKTTAAWQIFAELAQAGVPVAFADTDQFCMCYPALPGDPARERIKARNAGAFVARARAAVARRRTAALLPGLVGAFSCSAGRPVSVNRQLASRCTFAGCARA